MSEKSLTETLAELGYTHKPARNNGTTSAHDIIDEAGAVVFTGRADETWEWLHRECGIPLEQNPNESRAKRDAQKFLSSSGDLK